VPSFSNAPNEPAVVAIYVMPIYFDAPCRYCRNGRRATMNVRPVDYIGHRMAELNVCDAHKCAAHGLVYSASKAA
jgi:hypothetical protein